MKPSALIGTLFLSVAVYSDYSISATNSGDSGYAIQSVTGDMPIRNVVLKKVGQYFTTFFAIQFDCHSQKSSQTGFHSTPEAALADLSNTLLSDSIYSSLQITRA